MSAPVYVWVDYDLHDARELVRRLALAEDERDKAILDRDGFRNGQEQVQTMFDELWASNSAMAKDLAALREERDALRQAWERYRTAWNSFAVTMPCTEASKVGGDECDDALNELAKAFAWRSATGDQPQTGGTT